MDLPFLAGLFEIEMYYDYDDVQKSFETGQMNHNGCNSQYTFWVDWVDWMGNL